jgi:hypothetical protein
MLLVWLVNRPRWVFLVAVQPHKPKVSRAVAGQLLQSNRLVDLHAERRENGVSLKQQPCFSLAHKTIRLDWMGQQPWCCIISPPLVSIWANTKRLSYSLKLLYAETRWLRTVLAVIAFLYYTKTLATLIFILCLWACAAVCEHVDIFVIHLVCWNTNCQNVFVSVLFAQTVKRKNGGK